ncbi:unnamed protein product [Amoebophrya sp. A120]|nr:unnamed protein product [Amoebophrya sp. A120]|eukprot:GSA120T00010661001.1
MVVPDAAPGARSLGPGVCRSCGANPGPVQGRLGRHLLGWEAGESVRLPTSAASAVHPSRKASDSDLKLVVLDSVNGIFSSDLQLNTRASADETRFRVCFVGVLVAINDEEH